MKLDWPAAPILGSCLLLEYPCHSVRNSVYSEVQGQEQRAGGNKQRPANNHIHMSLEAGPPNSGEMPLAEAISQAMPIS